MSLSFALTRPTLPPPKRSFQVLLLDVTQGSRDAWPREYEAHESNMPRDADFFADCGWPLHAATANCLNTGNKNEGRYPLAAKLDVRKQEPPA